LPAKALQPASPGPAPLPSPPARLRIQPVRSAPPEAFPQSGPHSDRHARNGRAPRKSLPSTCKPPQAVHEPAGVRARAAGRLATQKHPGRSWPPFLARFAAAFTNELVREPRRFAFEQSRDKILQRFRIEGLSSLSPYRLRQNRARFGLHAVALTRRAKPQAPPGRFGHVSDIQVG